jgi:hypothetical protein
MILPVNTSYLDFPACHPLSPALHLLLVHSDSVLGRIQTLAHQTEGIDCRKSVAEL